MRNDVAVTVDVIATISGSSSVISDSSKSFPENGKAKFPLHVGHCFTVRGSPFL